MADAVPSPSAPVPPAQGDAQKTDGNPRTDSQARINELYGLNKRNERLAQQMAQERDALKNEIAELRGRVSAQAPPTTVPESWSEMNDKQLADAKRWARENDNGASLDAVYKEEARRLAAKAADEAVARAKREISAEQRAEQIKASILRDFGPDAFDQDSPLYQKADEFMGQVIRTHGRERAQDPLVLRTAFLEAERATKTLSERERNKALDEENRSMKERITLIERGGPPATMASQPNDAVKTALAAGDRKSAIKGLKFVQAMAGQAKADALKSRG